MLYYDTIMVWDTEIANDEQGTISKSSVVRCIITMNEKNRLMN